MYKDPLGAWKRFELMMRTGVPHAMDIAAELVRHDLQTPLPTHVPKLRIDLQFYCVIHRAYRADVLSRFLTTMTTLKQTSVWDELRDSQVAQIAVLQVCRESGLLSHLEIIPLVLSRLADRTASFRGVG